jgi:hypothetical protein
MGLTGFFTGPVDTITMHCVANGVSALHLQTLVENPGFGSSTMAVGGGYVITGLTDASVTCQGIAASPATAPEAALEAAAAPDAGSPSEAEALVHWIARLWDILGELGTVR